MGMYAFFASLVAVTSTLMHANQLRLGTCCCTADQEAFFVSLDAQKFTKRLDMFCATSALIACMFCRSQQEVFEVMVIGAPLFLGGALLKRMGWHYSYMVAHGTWHVVTASLVWYVLWPAFTQTFFE